MRIEETCWCGGRIEADEVNHEDLAHVTVLARDWREGHRCSPPDREVAETVTITNLLGDHLGTASVAPDGTITWDEGEDTPVP